MLLGRKFLLVLAVVLIAPPFLVAGYIAFGNWLDGDDLLTGDDPRIVQALDANNRIYAIERVPRSGGAYQVRSRVDQTTGYIHLIDGEILTKVVQAQRCNEPPAGWGRTIRRFPVGADWVCIRTETSAGERRYVSFTLRPGELDNAYDFYMEALDHMPATRANESREPDMPWKAYQVRMNEKIGQKVSILYFHDAGTAGPFVSVLEIPGR